MITELIDWKISEEKLTDMKAKAEQLVELTKRIKDYQYWHRSSIATAREFSGVFGPDANIVKHHIHAADIHKRTAKRLRQRFNNIINELQA